MDRAALAKLSKSERLDLLIQLLATLQPAAETDRLLAIPQAAERLGLSVKSLRHNWRRTPAYVALRVETGTRRVLFSARLIDEYLARLRAGAVPGRSRRVAPRQPRKPAPDTGPGISTAQGPGATIHHFPRRTV